MNLTSLADLTYHCVNSTNTDDIDTMMGGKLRAYLADEAIKNDKIVYEYAANCFCKKDSADKLEKLLLKSGLHQYWGKYIPYRDEVRSKAFVNDSSIVFLKHWENNDGEDGEFNSFTFEISVFSVNQKFILSLKDLADTERVEAPLQSLVYTIVSDGRGLDIKAMGKIKSPIIPGNYTPEVLEAVDQIIYDIRNPNPSGRLAIFDGPAGSGKTHLIKGIVSSVGECVFLLVPPDSVESLSGPSLVNLLINSKAEDGIAYEKPVVLILEDADNALVPRSRDNMSIISALLNCTDGIFGGIFDLKIIATTNAKGVEIEPALLRHGRLIAEVEVDELPAEQAEEVAKRLTGASHKIKEPMKLADIYALASKNKITSNRKTKKKMGF